MKLLLNLHPLGVNARGPQGRTGVYRVVEQLARGLAAAPEYETAFHAADSLWLSWGYYEAHLRGPRTRFATAPWRVRASRHLDGLAQTVAGTVQDRRPARRAFRFAAVRYGAAAARLLERIDGRALRETEVYHSPFLPVPDAIKRHARIQRFTTVYDLIPLSHPQFFDPGTTRVIQRMADGLGPEDYAACISEATRGELLARAPRLDPTRAFVTPLAAGPAFHPESDPARLAAARAGVGLPPVAPYLLSLCTLEPRKNLESVVRAFARLKGDGQVDAETRLVLVGNQGWKTESFFAALEAERGCRDSILLPGYVPDEGLAALYSGAAAFVYMPWLEGFGLPPLEAMQCGVPVICSNTSSLPEVAGDAGVLLAPDDADGIAGAMRALLLDGAHRRALAERALARARLFSWERFIGQHLEAYRGALADR